METANWILWINPTTGTRRELTFGCSGELESPPTAFAATAARALKVAQGAPERIDLLLTGSFLPLSDFQHLQQFVHFVQRIAQGIGDLIDVVDRLLDGLFRGGLSLLARLLAPAITLR